MSVPTRQVLFYHIIGWAFFLSLPLIFISAQGFGNNSALYLVPRYWLYFSIYPAIFYLHTYFLFPVLYLTKKYVLYGCAVVAMALAVFFLRPFDRSISELQQPGPISNFGNQPPGQNFPVPPDGPQGHDFGEPPGRPSFPGQPQNGIMPPLPNGPQAPPANAAGRGRPGMDIVSNLFFVLVMGLSITVQATHRWRIAARMAAQAETDKVNAELSFLKAQINPHFLFNTLNNIYALAVKKDDHTADSIMKLSNIMRYVTDEATGNFVSLQSEADCITDYIDLQKLRLGKKAEINYTTAGNLENKSIAPLILMTFVENVFKYGISSHVYSPITIKLAADESSISFFCQNHIFPASEIKESTGIGLANTRKRLQFLYPNRHLLNIDTHDKMFTVSLTLRTTYGG